MSITAQEMGERLSAYRVQRGMKVSQLARLIGVSPSLISQIERGQSRPSVSTLFGMAEALEVPVDAFFRDTGGGEAAPPAAAPAEASRPPVEAVADRPAREPAGAAPEPAGAGRPAPAPTTGEHRFVVRHDARASLDIEGGVRWERLTPAALDDFEFLELAYAPGAESNPTLYRHPGQEMVLVLSGLLRIFIGFEQYDLGPGDSIHFPSSLPHRYTNPTDQEARAVTVIIHDVAGAPLSSQAGRA